MIVEMSLLAGAVVSKAALTFVDRVWESARRLRGDYVGSYHVRDYRRGPVAPAGPGTSGGRRAAALARGSWPLRREHCP